MQAQQQPLEKLSGSRPAPLHIQGLERPSSIANIVLCYPSQAQKDPLYDQQHRPDSPHHRTFETHTRNLEHQYRRKRHRRPPQGHDINRRASAAIYKLSTRLQYLGTQEGEIGQVKEKQVPV